MNQSYHTEHIGASRYGARNGLDGGVDSIFIDWTKSGELATVGLA